MEGLYAHTQTVDGQSAKLLYIVRSEVVGVLFEGDLRFLLYLIYIIYMVKDVFQLFDGQLRGSSSTEIDGFYFLVYIVLPDIEFFA